ncbi:MAG TPA: hypothetical protein GX500_01570 [Firmicutes bacterium]|nr:hypothetical protein [Candidatus Fermentithermobacillaceae bacterium]
MRKTVTSLVVLVLMLVMLAGCSGGTQNTEPQTPPASSTPKVAKIGLGHITTIEKSTDLEVDADGNVKAPVGQVDTVIVAAAFDAEGKVVQVTIDTSQSKVAFDKDLQLTTDITVPGETKTELKDRYGMKRVSSIGKEWYEQAAELEKWMIGKTVDEIKAMKTKQRDESHPAVPDVPELTSLVTITVQDYIAALEEAYKNAVEVPEGGAKFGLGHVVDLASSKGYSNVDGTETLPLAQVNTTIAATLFDKDGKVLRTVIDTCQTKVTFDKDGKVTSDKTAELKSKVELGDGYGMKRASSIGKEWFEQIAELEKWMAGKTVSEIKAMKTKQRDASHPAVPDVPELTSLVTITVQDYLAAVEESYNNAKDIAK